MRIANRATLRRVGDSASGKSEHAEVVSMMRELAIQLLFERQRGREHTGAQALRLNYFTLLQAMCRTAEENAEQIERLRLSEEE